MTDNFDISNNQQKLFAAISRSYQMDGIQGAPMERGVRLNNYTGLINFRSDANYPRQRNNQLDFSSYIGVFGKENSQPSKLPVPLIDCTPRHNIPSSRFNYAIDQQITNNIIDVSGISIPNRHLRILPNRGTQLAYQNLNMSSNPEIERLANTISKISAEPAETRNNLKFKASRQRLNRDELLGIRRIPKPPDIASVRVVP